MSAHDVLDERVTVGAPLLPVKLSHKWLQCRGTGRSVRACQLALSAEAM